MSRWTSLGFLWIDRRLLWPRRSRLPPGRALSRRVTVCRMQRKAVCICFAHEHCSRHSSESYKRIAIIRCRTFAAVRREGYGPTRLSTSLSTQHGRRVCRDPVRFSATFVVTWQLPLGADKRGSAFCEGLRVLKKNEYRSAGRSTYPDCLGKCESVHCSS
jgi:hypothetical protein